MSKQVSAITNLELDVEVSGTLVEYRPAVMYRRNGDPGDPAEGGYCEDIVVLLTKNVKVKNPDGTFKTVKKELDITEFVSDAELNNMQTWLYEEAEIQERDEREFAMSCRSED